MNKLLLASAVLIVPAAHAFADPFSWVNWTSVSGTTATGTILTTNGNIGVTLNGPFATVLTGYPSWTPATSYADGSIIDNAPDNGSLVKINSVGDYTLTFDQAVDNLAFSVWSVGQGGNAVSYTFDHNLSFVAGDPGAEYAGQSITTTANTLTGEEGNGTVLFSGPLTSLSWHVDPAEDYHGFTIGLKNAQPVPEPASMAILGIGVGALLRRRRKA